MNAWIAVGFNAPASSVEAVTRARGRTERVPRCDRGPYRTAAARRTL